MKPFVTSMLAATLVCAVALAGYHRFIVQPAQRIGIVDLDRILSERQTLFTSDLIKANNDQERGAIQRQAVEFAATVQTAMDELAGECGCLVLDRTVVVGPRPGMPDLTLELKRKVHP